MKLAGLLLSLLLGIAIAACTQLPKPCDKLEGGPQTQCIMNLAVSQGQQGLCISLKDPDANAACLTGVAGKLNATGPCDGIPDPRTREFCRRDVIVQQGSLDGCAQLRHLPAKDSCYNSFAHARQDWHVCSEMSTSQYRDDCIEQISRKTSDPLGCKALASINPGRDDCLFALSIKARDIDSCLEIVTPESRDYCVLNIAVALKNSLVCGRITDSTKDLCLQLVNASQNASAPSNLTTAAP